MISEIKKNWFELALPSSTVDVYCTSVIKESKWPSDKPCCAVCRIINADQQRAGMETAIRDRRNMLKLRGEVHWGKKNSCFVMITAMILHPEAKS